jgi:hypothetical protein
VTLAEFERYVFAVAMDSSVCGIPSVRSLTPTSVNLRIDIAAGGFVDVFYNERSGTTSYALIREGRRILGADSTGGWHQHPFDDPDRHEPLAAAMPFDEFVVEVERHAEG